MSTMPFAAAVAATEPASVSFEETPSTIGRGKRHSLPISQFTFEPPSTSPSALVTTPEHETQAVSWDSMANNDDGAEAAGNTTPKLKARRVSTSALPTLAGPSSNWAFRDEMGIPNRGDASTPGPSRPTVERSESAEVSRPARAPRPRKALSMSEDARQLEAAADASLKPAPKRARRNMWTEEETMHLVEGCKVHGVGNWKMILDDPRFIFQDRSPVDLKDRFRVSFPEAYRKHYPNAKTHLSHRTTTSFPEGSPVFEKSVPKKRRPFTAEEDAALKRGYEKYGTLWASIARDPIFASRRSTDLRDRFRNAFPDLYVKAGYKPRAPTKKNLSEPVTPFQQPSSSSATPVEEDVTMHRRSVTPSPPKYRRRSEMGGRLSRSVSMRPYARSAVQSADHSTPGSEDEAEAEPMAQHDTSSPDGSLSRRASDYDTSVSTQQSSVSSAPSLPTTNDESNSMFPQFAAPQPRATPPDSMPPPALHRSYSDEAKNDYVSMASTSATQQQSQPPANVESSFVHFGVSAPTSPAVSGLRTLPSSSSTRIGNSAWGPSAWLSANPRLDSSDSVRPSSFLGIGWPIPEHGVFDRYDLYNGANVPAPNPTDFASDAGDGKAHPHFMDTSGATPGFTHHHYAGDLISGGGGLYSNQDLEYLSTTSGTTSHLDVGQLSLQSQEDDDANLFAMDEQPFGLSDDATFASLSSSVERPRTADAGGSNREFFRPNMGDFGSPLQRPSTSMSFSYSGHAGPSSFFPSSDRGATMPHTTPTSPYLGASQPVNFDDSLGKNPHVGMQRSRSSTSFMPFGSSSSAQAPAQAPPPAPSSFKRFGDPSTFLPFSQTQQSSTQPFDYMQASTSTATGSSSMFQSSSSHPPPVIPPQPSASGHHRSSSQPPREHRYHFSNGLAQVLPPSSSSRPFASGSSSVYDFLSLDDVTMSLGASSSAPSNAFSSEPLSTAALDLHYGTHFGRLTPSFIRDHPNDPLVVHSAFMHGLELGLGLALQHGQGLGGAGGPAGTGSMTAPAPAPPALPNTTASTSNDQRPLIEALMASAASLNAAAASVAHAQVTPTAPTAPSAASGSSTIAGSSAASSSSSPPSTNPFTIDTDAGAATPPSRGRTLKMDADVSSSSFPAGVGVNARAASFSAYSHPAPHTSAHTRGQSFTVSPRDLGLGLGLDGMGMDELGGGADGMGSTSASAAAMKKRKRASWDGRQL